jgi:hypothetical protein
MSPKELVQAAKNSGLDGVVVTDHDTTVSVEEVRTHTDSLDVVSGVEITTSEGHILGIGIEEAPKPQIKPIEAVEYIQSRGGYAILAHPFDKLRENFQEGTLEKLLGKIDGVESVNSRCLSPKFNARALDYAEKNNLLQTGGSDSHFSFEVGRAYTRTDKPLLDALGSENSESVGRGMYVSGHICTKLNDILKLFLN